jgi:hypothetical protein
MFVCLAKQTLKYLKKFKDHFEIILGPSYVFSTILLNIKL